MTTSFTTRRSYDLSGIAVSLAPPEEVKKWIDLYRAECAKEGWEPTPNHILYRGITYCAETDEQAYADMEAYFGMKAEESAKLQSATLGGPPVLDLVAKPYFVGGPETMLKKLEEIGRASGRERGCQDV